MSKLDRESMMKFFVFLLAANVMHTE